MIANQTFREFGLERLVYEGGFGVGALAATLGAASGANCAGAARSVLFAAQAESYNKSLLARKYLCLLEGLRE